MAGRVYRKIGEPGLPRKSKFDVIQDYESLKALHSATNKFEDPEFPANSSSFGIIDKPEYVSDQSPWGLTWARPAELSQLINKCPTKRFPANDNPRVTFFGPRPECSRFDVQQGALGDCWYVSSLSLLATKTVAYEVCVPKDNADGFDAGIFHFRFHNRGIWLDVVVDDRLPYIIDKNNGDLRPAFVNVPRVGDEYIFWAALAEKAYAKMYGSYALLVGGYGSEALEDFTGGYSEPFYFPPEVTPDSVKIVKDAISFAVSKDAFLSVSSKAHAGGDTHQNEVGIVYQHAYVIVAVEPDVKDAEGKSSFLVKARNPWGRGEFRGKWSDRDPAWEGCPDKQRLQLVWEDGEFWICVEDLIKYYGSMSITYWDSGKWNMSNFKTKTFDEIWPGELEVGVPDQSDEALRMGYLVELNPTTEGKSDFGTGNDCTLIVDVTYRDYYKPGTDLEIPYVGFLVAKVYDAATPANFIKNTDETFQTRKEMVYFNRRKTARLTLPPAKYCVVPFTCLPSQEQKDQVWDQEYTFKYVVTQRFTRPYSCTIVAETKGDITPGIKTEYIPPAPSSGFSDASEDEGTVAKEGQSIFESAGDQVDAVQLRSILSPHIISKHTGAGPSIDAYEFLLKIADLDRDGKLTKAECVKIYPWIKSILTVFDSSLSNKESGFLTQSDFGYGLSRLGFKFDNVALLELKSSYGERDYGGYGLDAFLQSVCTFAYLAQTRKN